MGGCVPSKDGLQAVEAAPVKFEDAFSEEAAQTSSPVHLVDQQNWKVRPQIIEGANEGLADRYRLGQQIGEGNYGVVFEALDSETGEMVAVKRLPKAKILSDKDVYNVNKEIGILKDLRGHQHIVRFDAAYEDSYFVYVVLELCRGGDMLHTLLKEGRYSERDAADLCRSILSVAAYCHSKGIMHRDLKPDNFLLDGEGELATLKATDFGLSARFLPGEYLHDACGTPLFVAPEVLKRNFNEKCDIWSVGVILYLVLSGTLPFNGKTVKDTLRATMNGRYDFNAPVWSSVSDDAKDCIIKMLIYDPGLRPSAAEMLEHPWIKQGGTASEEFVLQAVFDNLRGFSTMNKLKKHAIQLMVANLQTGEIEKIRKEFEIADVDRSGSLTVGEIKAVLRRVKADITEDELSRIWSAYDIDENGEIDYSEFLTATSDHNKINNIENIERAFSQLDKDRDGRLTKQEIMKALKGFKISEADVQDIIAQFDRSGDGSINYAEFVTMMIDDASRANRSALKVDVANFL
eukprot:Plantae.Rhodophyta-Purpureofilum_apyrenoidigerum.ctg6257.p1 GENE.Plantae.Rhodophyta-Purpureofilum_apyrenoidigerum.ctg6257~~Plantae.Rhodophyta-Purpureofilum_apyrenoidigerum.ctg6257.p1  ORF type:complete len:534 (+),score=115.17 Plantae.Rhodophyta-Purpureofilum_apyrenoidigerum.ctg6257:46-1602(+)